MPSQRDVDALNAALGNRDEQIRELDETLKRQSANAISDLHAALGTAPAPPRRLTATEIRKLVPRGPCQITDEALHGSYISAEVYEDRTVGRVIHLHKKSDGTLWSREIPIPKPDGWSFHWMSCDP